MTNRFRRSLPDDRIFGAVNALLLFVVCLAVLYPIYYMLIVSVSDGMAVMRGEVYLLPVKLNFKAYQTLLSDPNVPNAYLNTLKYTFFGTLINVTMTALCAYPLSRPNFYGRRVFSFLVIFTMLFDVGMIANFMVVFSLGLKNTMWAMVLPPAINVWYMVIMRTFFQQIPDELHQSAYVDGANDLRIFYSLILPLSAPVLSTMLLFYAVWHWNAFMPALLYMDNRVDYPMQLILRNIVISGDMASMEGNMNTAHDVAVMEKNIKYAAIFITIAPVLLLYPFVQKYFTKGIMVGSLKG